MTGVLVAFEGGEGCGKSTQARLLAERLGARAVLTREPGATALGAALRGLLLDPTSVGGAAIDARAEALLMAADRAQHVAEVLRPSLEAGRVVVTDRYIGSSLAYQGAGRGLGVEAVAEVSHFATGGLAADVVVLLTVPAAVRAERLATRAVRPDRFESEDGGFHDRVEAAFARLAAADPDRWRVVDGAGPAGEVAERVWAVVSPLLS